MFEFEGGSDDMLARGSQVVLISSADLFDESVKTEAFENAGHLSGCLGGQVKAEGFVLKAADVVFAAGDGFKQKLVVGIEEVEAWE